MYSNTRELKMPSNYVDMSQSELQYDGGSIVGKTFEKVALVAMGVMVASAIAGLAFMTFGAGAVALGVALGGVLISGGVAGVSTVGFVVDTIATGN